MCTRESSLDLACEQGAEMLPNCTQSSLVYENVCGACNPGAEEDKELKEVKQDIPTLYVGETSRNVYERSKEHWGAYKGRKEDSHMWKHQMMEHSGEQENFVMRVLGSNIFNSCSYSSPSTFLLLLLLFTVGNTQTSGNLLLS